jgi:hypothetical protein
VSGDQDLKAGFVPGDVQVDQFLVLQLVVAHNNLLLGFRQLVWLKT